jgi:hypothetical protein
MVEGLLAMWAAGGERAEDLDQFRQDKALALLLGHELPAAQTARDFLAQFHAEGRGEPRQGPEGSDRVPAGAGPNWRPVTVMSNRHRDASREALSRLPLLG